MMSVCPVAKKSDVSKSAAFGLRFFSPSRAPVSM